MGWATWFFGAAIATLSSVWILLLGRYWALRRDFIIAARSPELFMVSSIGAFAISLSILLHWFLLSLGRNLPCAVYFWVSHSANALCGIPYGIRAVRLIVAYNRSFRLKYARFVKWRPILGAWAVISTGLASRAALFFGKKPSHRSSDSLGCLLWDDIVLSTIMGVLAGIPVLFLAGKLLQVHDAFKIRQEIVGVVLGCSICHAAIGTLNGLTIFKAVPDTRLVYFIGEVFGLLWGFNGFTWGLLIPLVRAHRESNWSWCTHAVHPIEYVVGTTPSVGSLLALARIGGATAERFAKFAQENLCQESWDFILDCVQYEMVPSGSDEQFSTFFRILDQYLLPTSPDEVNISSKMSKRMASFRTRTAFDELNDEERTNVLSEPMNEIVRMLEQNLLTKFQARISQERDAEISEAAKGDSGLLTLMRSSNYHPSAPTLEPTP